MLTVRSIIRVVVWGAALTGSIAAIAGPVTDADLRGKRNYAGTPAWSDFPYN